MKIKRRYKSTGGVGTIKEYVGHSEDHHWYMVTMIPHNKGKARRVQERSISRCFSGYSSFDDVLNADERRRRRRLEERSRIKCLSAANKEHRKEIKNLQRQARSLEEELSVLKKENDKYRREMSEFKLHNLFSRTRPAANGIIMNIRDYVKMA